MDTAACEYLNQTNLESFENKRHYDQIEADFFSLSEIKFEKKSKSSTDEQLGSNLAKQVSKIRSQIKEACDSAPDSTMKLSTLTDENTKLRNTVERLESAMLQVTARLDRIEAELKNVTKTESKSGSVKIAEPVKEKEVEEEDDDDDVDLFGSSDEEEDAEAAKVRADRLKAYAAKKSVKPGPIAKSSVMIDVKPWDDETDLKEMENIIRTIEMDGLKWGAAKTAPLAFGICKLQILCIVEDDKVSIDDLTEKIEEFEDFVQSTDIAAFNKI